MENSGSTHHDKSSYFSDEFVRQVRDALLERISSSSSVQLKKNGELKCEDEQYDKEDVERLKNNDYWFVRRFLVEKPSTTVEVAVKKVHDAMVWRKKFGVNQLHDAMFPAEFYNFGGMFQYLPDKDGNNVIIIRSRLNQRHPKLPFNAKGEEIQQKFFIHLLEKVIVENPNRKVGLVMDFQYATVANADMKMAKFLVSTLLNYYYDIMIWGCFFEMPWILNKLWLLIRVCLSEESRRRVRFCTKHNITEYISREHLPDFMGGTGVKNYRHVPEGTPSMDRWAVEVGVVESHNHGVIMKQLFDHLSTI